MRESAEIRSFADLSVTISSFSRDVTGSASFPLPSPVLFPYFPGSLKYSAISSSSAATAAEHGHLRFHIKIPIVEPRHHKRIQEIEQEPFRTDFRLRHIPAELLLPFLIPAAAVLRMIQKRPAALQKFRESVSDRGEGCKLGEKIRHEGKRSSRLCMSAFPGVYTSLVFFQSFSL